MDRHEGAETHGKRNKQGVSNNMLVKHWEHVGGRGKTERDGMREDALRMCASKE